MLLMRALPVTLYNADVSHSLPQSTFSTESTSRAGHSKKGLFADMDAGICKYPVTAEAIFVGENLVSVILVRLLPFQIWARASIVQIMTM